jgi:peptide/nickel transport system permease protein
MRRDILFRLGAAAVTMLCAAFVAFTLLSLAPGDRARLVANARFGGEGAGNPEILAAIRAELGLDRPLAVQFLDWLANASRLDLGTSFVNQRPVSEIVLDAFAETIPLALLAFGFGVLVAGTLACVAVIRPRSPIDTAVVALSSLCAAMPSFWTGLLLILVFAVGLGWLPAYGNETALHAVLPAFTLSTWLIAARTRVFRAFLREGLSAPYLDALRVRGVGETTLLVRHVMPHVLVAALPILCLDLAVLLEGAVIVETVFARPGVATALLGALLGRDYPVAMCLIVAAAFAYVAANALSDILALRLDPRLRQGKGGRP